MPPRMLTIRPPFTEEFLQSSQRLSASEIAIATEFISLGEHCISYMDAAITRAGSQEELYELTQQRKDMVQQVLQHKNAIRCLRRLPFEIVSKFLVFALPYVEPDDFGETPWYLGHICRYWRDVALASPSLWSDIVIMRPNKYPTEKFQTQLTRSSNSPLKVLLWSSSSSRGNPHVTEFLKVLVDCAPRWTNACIFINPTHWNLLASLRSRVPLLRYLRIGVSDFLDPDAKSTELTNPLEIAPALRDLTLEDISGLPHGLVLPFHQLTRLKLATTSESIAAILQTTTNLELASLDLTDDPPDAVHPIIRLPHLRRLYLSSQPFLEQLELPALEEIYMVDTPPAPFLSSFVQRCPTMKLKTLRLAWCTPAHIARILEACPSVETLGLQIMSSDKGDELLTLLTVQRSTSGVYTGIGPNLHSIALGLDRVVVKHGLFVDMVESRWRLPADRDNGGSPFCRLRSAELLVVDEGNALSASMERRLDVLKKEGLRISLLQGSAANSELLEWRI
ncbi:hypothetical protein MVEN_00624800 [Mycena venus]|uniref:F-box domain-containing protein n=1 Tax=Mycena venus TaxID=2733690 RepID=A0A8H6YMM2_9AGAR|nr:hypothetical protein MVEN_00624800 [Mycena venus]